MQQRIKSQYDLFLALGAFAIAFVLWQFRPFSPIVYPLRLFVTFIHELGHGTAAILTGGEFIRFEVMSNGAGLAYSSGGVRPLVIAAGYVGTAIFGAVLLSLANHVRQPKWVAVGLGLGFIGLTFLFTGLDPANFNLLEGLLGFGLLLGAGYLLLTAATLKIRRAALLGVGLGFVLLLLFAAGDNRLTLMVGGVSGLLLLLLGLYARREITLFVLNFLAFAVGLNAITDAWFLLQVVSSDRFTARNDATAMAAVTPLPATAWALLWILLAGLLLGGAAWFSFIRPFQNGRPDQKTLAD